MALIALIADSFYQQIDVIALAEFSTLNKQFFIATTTFAAISMPQSIYILHWDLFVCVLFSISYFLLTHLVYTTNT